MFFLIYKDLFLFIYFIYKNPSQNSSNQTYIFLNLTFLNTTKNIFFINLLFLK
jgi:hypothetical protein